MKTKILRNIFLSVGVLFASARLLSAGMNDGILDFGDTPLCHSHPTFITFDPPGGPARDMLPSGINPAGAVTGTYVDANLVSHGFLRARDGTFTTIDPPGSIGAYVGNYFGLVGPPINPAGAITGTYLDASGVQHGFLRARDGTFTTFDPPGSTLTVPQGINAARTITGFYFDVNSVFHGFLRAPDGTFTTFDAPGAVLGTAAEGINCAGTIAGFYADASFVFHGFLRARDGTFTSFDAPGSAPPFGTNPTGINPAGAITGWYFDMSSVFHGFLRAPDGTITNVDPPGSEDTFAAVINPAGVITGDYVDASGATHGFLRIP
jgi:hypothetical protein